MKQLPAGWKETTLGDIVEIVGWWTPKTSEPQYWNWNIPWLSVVDFNNDNRRVYYTEKTITEEGLKNSSTKILNEWDLIISARWTVWALAQLKRDMAFNQSCYGIKQLDGVSDKNFLFYLLKNSISFLSRNVHWAVFDTITRETFDIIPIHLPPLPEQQAIAAVLSSFDDKIELLRAENQTLEQMGQELFKERFGKWKVGDELPEGWRVGKITEIIRRESISYKCDKKDLDDKGLTPILDQGSTGLYGYTSRDPDFIVTKDSPVIIFTNHTCNFWFIDYPFCAIQNVLPYRWINGYDVYFLYFMTKGSIKFTEYKWHRPSFVALDFVIPPVELAQEFSKIAERILNKILWNKEQIQSLSATRDQLLPKLMSGEVRVEF